MRHIASLRVWLQSTSLLVVVAGYASIFIVGRSVLRSEFIYHHKDVVSSLLVEFTPNSSLKSLHRHKNLSAVVIQGAEPWEPIVYTQMLVIAPGLQVWSRFFPARGILISKFVKTLLQ